MAFVSYIVPARNEEEYILACLEAIVAQEFSGEHEVIVVDNASTDRTVELVRRRFPEVTVISEKRLGTSIARNRGAQGAHGDVLCFVDADVRLPKDWTRKALATFEANPRLVALSGPYRFTDTAPLFRAFLYVLYAFVFVPLGNIVGALRHRGFNVIFGGNVAVRREAFEAVDGFNDALPYWGDDTWLAVALTRRGRVRFSNALRVDTTARRFRRGGYVKVHWLYMLNFLSIVFHNRPFSKSG